MFIRVCSTKKKAKFTENIKCYGENTLYTQALLINSYLISTAKLKAGLYSKLYCSKQISHIEQTKV